MELIIPPSHTIRLHVQGAPCLAIAFGEGGSPHKTFGLELRAERLTPPDKLGVFDMPDVQICFNLTFFATDALKNTS